MSSITAQAQAQAGVSSTVLPEIIEIPWTAGLQLGSGYDVVTGLAASGALARVTVPSSVTATSKDLYVHYIRTQSDFDRLIEASASGSGNADGVTITASAEVQNTVQFSSTSSTLLIRYVESASGYDTIEPPALTPEAQQLLHSDPQGFHATHGDYYVSGGRRMAEFDALYIMKASSSASLTKVQASVSASAPDLFTAKGAAKFVQSVKASSVELEVRIVMTPTEGHEPTTAGKDPGSLAPSDVLAALAWFKEHARHDYEVAQLTHYSALDQAAGHTAPVPPSYFTDVVQLRVSVADAARLFATLPEHFRPAHQEALELLREDAHTVRSQYLNDPDMLPRVQAKADAFRAQVAPVSEFFDALRAVAGNDGGAGRIRGGGGRVGIGRNGDTTVVPAEIKVSDPVTLRCHKEATVGEVTGAVDWSRKGARIVSVDVTRNWKTDPGRVVTYRGGLGHDSIHVGFEGEYDRGFSWDVVLRYVDCD